MLQVSPLKGEKMNARSPTQSWLVFGTPSSEGGKVLSPNQQNAACQVHDAMLTRNLWQTDVVGTQNIYLIRRA